MTDYSHRRTVMVDTQVRPSDVTRFPIIEALLRVPREVYVPEGLQDAAYIGENLPLAENRVMLEPRTFAKMLEAADIQPGDLVLDIGPGLGYSACVLAHLAEAVVALEEDEDMAREAAGLLSEHGADNVAVIEGPLAAGLPQHGPYDVIVIEGAVEAVGDALLAQLKEGGRIVAPFVDGALGAVRVGYKLNGTVSWRFAFNAGAPVLPGFEQQKDFAL
ncbi:protein-L-isoaspartate O-methyltransferase family protein [Mangrovicoccus algicola]|uniref:Protein-L-isoaspartate O-methyltransferase n=1 Tax=Mangrovicoccus algicola TaxID=2771008 RepID=A0A8J7CKP9_9RHOB|nr:protein-L-isoaspartate O-methyltransferase [Mangrovicoccus algicola]MBE3639106.1 protein-L-isoaspartate O-methyltransferase [Mangrovicoccus algicola]